MKEYNPIKLYVLEQYNFKNGTDLYKRFVVIKARKCILFDHHCF